MNRKLALITGGTSGIGLGIAKKLAAHCDLALAYASNEAKANEAKQAILQLEASAQVKLFKRPLRGKADCDALYLDVQNEFGGSPAILVNSAGRLHDGLFLSADFAEYIRVLDEHLVVAMAMSQLALKAMYKEKFGRIINMSSISSFYAKRGQSNYAAAKAGLEAFTRTLALEVAHRGVTVNAIAPGLIETPMTKALVEKINASEGGIKDRIPARRMGQPEEVGALAAFLCSHDAAYITGTVIPIDGGRSLGDPLS